MKISFFLVVVFCCFSYLAYGQKVVVLQNSAYRITVKQDVNADPVCTVERVDQPDTRRILNLELTQLYTDKDPNYGRVSYNREITTHVAGWTPATTTQTDFYKVASTSTFRAKRIQQQSSQTVTLGFDSGPASELILVIGLSPDAQAPLLRWSILPKQKGWFSVGFTGIQPVAATSLDFLYQPLVWSWKRFPIQTTLTPEAFATTAAVFTTANDVTEGITPDPVEIPYRFATFSNSRFGLSVRDNNGQARPMLFAPILGGQESALQPGQVYTFGARYALVHGSWYTGLTYILKSIFAYRNERQNATQSLNQTFENMVSYALNDKLAGWIPDLKGSDYRTDVQGTVKNVSALHPLSIALTTGDMDVYLRRAVPMMEYVMSRQKLLFSIEASTQKQAPSHFLYGPCVEMMELASLNDMLATTSQVFKAETNRIFGQPRTLNLQTVSGDSTWQDYLARYRVVNDKTLLAKAKTLADAYLKTDIDNYPTDFTNSPGLIDSQAAFYTDFGPKGYDLLELYEETNEKKYADAAILAAKQLLLWLRSNPFAPDSVITVNKGGKVPAFSTNALSDSPEQRVPAWRTSLVGLPPEQPNTYAVGGPIMLTNHAAFLLRIASLTQDSLFQEAAYNAILGRYANFPGYYFTSLATTIYQQPDYPLHEEIFYNAFFYNHIWDHIALLQDFLVSDARLKSKGQITFPSAYAPGYAYLTSKVYGHRPGMIFGNTNIRLWLPAKALQSTTTALNHLLGYSDKDTYLVLTNTTAKEVKADLFLNPDVVRWNADQTYPITTYRSRTDTTNGTFQNGQLAVNVPANGLVAVKLRGLTTQSATQQKPITLSSTAQNYFRQQTSKPSLGTITGMLFNLVSSFANAYVYCDATEEQTQKVTFTYKLGTKDWVSVDDISYPFEFSLKFIDPVRPLQVKMTAIGVDGQRTESDTFVLKN